jgi:predicted peptidase
MGGYGTWELASIHPEWFAAIMPVCGGGICWFASRLKDIPVRTFHGLLDKVVDPVDSLQMAKAVNGFGGHCEMILFPHLEHNCWDTVYTTEENYDWLLSHTLHSKKAEEEKLSGEIYG